MKTDLDSKLLDLDGIPLRDGVFPDGKEICVKHVLEVELLRPVEKDAPGKKLEKFALALKVHGGGEVDLAVEDVALLLELVGKNQSPLIYGRVKEILDPKPKAT